MQPNGFYNPSINHQQNQPMVPHQANYNNWYNVQQFSNNGMNNYYNSTPIAYQLPKYNNGFLMPTNVPYIPPYNNTYNANFSNNGYIPQSMQPAFQPTLSYSYNNVILPNQNVNVNNATNFNRQMTSNTTTCYQGNQFTHNMPSKVNPVNINYEPQVSGSNNQNVNNATNFNMQMTSNTTTCYQGKNFNMQMTSNTTTCYQGKQFTHNMPSKVNPVNINYEPQVSGSNNQNVSNSKKDNKWFNSRSTFVNNTSTNLAPNFSMVPNTHQTNSKQNCSMNNQSINTRNPKTISKIFSRTTKPFGTEKISEKLSIHQIIAKERKKYYHSSESDFYKKKLERSIFMPLEICNEFERVLGKRAKHVNVSKPVYNKDHKRNFKVYKCKCSKIKKYDNSDSFSLSDEDSDCENDKLKELALKCAHPDRLHPDIWYNELGELNDGPVCKCSPSSQNLGILHNIYVGEVPFESCLPNTNNADKLYHYRITITPLTNYLHKYPTIIKHNHHNYTFEGFSLLSHYPLPTMPTCTFTRFNTHYTIIYIEEKIPDNFIIQDDSFSLSDEDSDCENDKLKELALKCAHPDRLHPDIWYNELGELNDGPVCKCSPSSQNLGILHNIYVGEVPFESCLPNTNNADKLYHYRITITPLTNYLHKYPTVIKHKHNNYTFEGFSLLSHYPIPTMPTCTFTRFNTHYTIIYIEEKIPDNFIIQELTLFYDFFFKDILELVDFDFHAIRNKDGCPQFHFIPRFVRDLSNNKKELLSMSNVLKYLLNSNKLLFEENSLPALQQMSSDEWQVIVDEYKDMIITNPETKPSSIRVDQLDRENKEDTIDKKDKLYPVVVHFGIRPAQICYVGNKEFKKYSKDYLKIKHLLDNKIDPSPEDEKELEIIERALDEIRSNNKMKRTVTTAFSSKGFYKTGLMCDVAQHAMLLPILVSHFKFYKSLEYLEKSIEYKFKDKNLLKLALTHSSYRENFGTNSDHIRNTLTNCGMRQLEYGDRQNSMFKRKRGLKTLIYTMSRFGEMEEMESNSKNNERLEFLGDAVIEFVTTIHLFSIFPDLEEGGLATYRSALVENRHLTFLARNLKLEDYMLYAHGADLCYCFEHAKVLANCFEALIGAIFLDGGIEAADCVFGKILYKDSPEHFRIWVNYPKHPLQQQNPNGDRECIKISPFLKKLTKYEDSIGVKFNHIRLLAKAFTHKSVGFTNLTLGSNQRLEFLGDSVLQFITSDYLYNCYPEHHEGHLSLLRSSLVKNQTQSDLCNDLDMVSYALRSNQVPEFQIKDKADLVEAFIGALFLDKGLRYCREFCNVCFFPRLPNSIEKPNCHDSKSKLQTYFQNLQPFHVRNPVIPIYKTIEITGPGHCLKHTVGVYFKGVRISTGNGQSKHKAEMNAATIGLEVCKDLFPQLNYQRNAIPRSSHHQSMNGNRNYMIIRQMLETQSSINDTSLSKLEKERNELKYKLLTVLCSDNDFIEENTEDKNKKRNKEEVDEPVRKKLKGKPKT
ncbi:Ribonuclease III domain,Double-stranded RNA-binding domain,Ribonuclease III [Cinara cedri]|uniref:Ribonuclease III domain,Double-stranded RNA-binding domain,Ribonuclease III n=1 Tax=Cinara cedri TaxID=506608 RepID=A0A5E4N7H9_9HEMI|nr:Ribonuclease III domain,Double-stranded RNA-binding domain,Ribonuclease III [Cinara cedri]